MAKQEEAGPVACRPRHEERDFAGRQIIGRREVQEDRYGVIPPSEFGGGPADLLVVVCDGMGGHDAGEVASELAVTHFAQSFIGSQECDDAARLGRALDAANEAIARGADGTASCPNGMGTTLLGVLVRGHALRWISVGDSPLFLLRDGVLERLNRIHSGAAEIEEMVRAGILTRAEARVHPDRHMLLSAVIGERIEEIDAPPPATLRRGDVLIACTDGIDTLTTEEIAEIAARHAAHSAAAVAEALLEEVQQAAYPRQDNTTVVVVCVPD